MTTYSSAASRNALSKIASKRLQKELVEWQLNPPAGFNHKLTDNLQKWVIEVNGAPDTLYANEMYQLQVDFPEHPMESPQVIFLHPALQHPHICSNGHICLVWYFLGSTEAVEFATIDLYPFGKVEKYVPKLQDVMALLAYEEPEKSPMFHLLSKDYRQQAADSLNRAILAHSNLPSYPAMERLIQQTAVIRQSLSEDNSKSGSQSFSLKEFLGS